MVVVTKLGNKLDVKDEAIALDMIEKNVGWKIEGWKIEGDNETPTRPSKKKSEPTD